MIRRLASLAVLLAVSASAQPTAPLVVGVSDTPPFAIRGTDGTWDGLGVHLLREAALGLGRDVTFREVPRDEAWTALADGDVDVLAAVVASPEAETVADLTPSYYTAALGSASRPTSAVADAARMFLTPTFALIAGVLSALLLAVGAAAWLFERTENDDDFRPGAEGIWDGFWWAGVTMSTIGYGDLVPKTVGGRVLGLVWMIVSMGVTAALTAAVVSTLGIQGSTGSLRLPDDLRDARVGVVSGSLSESDFLGRSVDARAFPTIEAGLEAVRADSIDLFVASAPLLRANVGSVGLDLRVETTALRPQRWALAVAEGSDLREPLARAVLQRIGGPDWRAAVERYAP